MPIKLFAVAILWSIYSICIEADGVVSIEMLLRKIEGANPESGNCANNGTICAAMGSKCCRYRNAVCCNDNLHCCPEATTCDIEGRKCIPKSTDTMEWPVLDVSVEAKKVTPSFTVERTPLLELFQKLGLAYVCPNQTVCPGLQTCCYQGNNKYGCCPFPNGSCCLGGLACCAAGLHCLNNRCY